MATRARRRQAAFVAATVGILLLLLPACVSETGGREAAPEVSATVPATPTASPTPTPAPAVATPAPPPAWLALEAELGRVVAEYSVDGRYAFAVTDLQTGHTLSVNGDRPQPGGCVMNFFVLLAAMREVQDGRLALEDVDSLIRQTIWSSNPVTAHALYRIVGNGDVLAGVRQVQALMRDTLGLSHAVLDHPPGYMDESLGLSADNLITVNETNRALAALYRGEILREPWRSIFLERLTAVYSGLNFLVASVPGGTVSHKNGFFYEPADDTWVDNDIGIVRFTRGGQEYAFAVSFFSQGVSIELGDVPLGQELMDMVWDHFQATYAGG